MNLTPFFVFLLLCNVFIGLFFYIHMLKKRKLFTDRYGMVMAMCSSGILSFVLAIILHFSLPFPLAIVAISSTIIGGGLGIIFGSLVKFQSLLAGFFQGSSGGVMGTMFGAVIENPALCGLPASYFTNVEQNMVIFSMFGTGLVFSTFGLLFYSLRV